MTAEELLSQLRAKGVDLKTSDGRLIIDAPKGTITQELRNALSKHKAEMMQILIAEQETARQVVPSTADVTPPKQIASIAESKTESPSEPAPKREISGPPGELAQLEAELMRLRTEEEARRAEVEAERLAADKALRMEQEKWRLTEEEIARRRAEQERLRIEAEVRVRAEEEKRRQIADQEIARAEEELWRMRGLEEARRKEVEEQVAASRQAHEAQLASLRQVEEEQSRRRAEEERNYLENQARKRAQEEELRRRAESRFRLIEEEIERVHQRERAFTQAERDAQRLAEEAEARRASEETRRQAEERARRRAEDEARLRAEIEAQLRAEAAERRRAEEEARRRMEEEARRRAEQEAQHIAAEHARHLAEAEAQRRAEEETRRAAQEAARLQAEEAARRQATEQARQDFERAEREREEYQARERAELEKRIRAEIEAKIRGEEDEQRAADDAVRRRAEHDRIVAEEAAKESARFHHPLEVERGEADVYETAPSATPVKEIVEWFNMEPAATASENHFADIDDVGGEFRPVSLPEDTFESAVVSSALVKNLRSDDANERAAAVSQLARVGGEQGYHHICAAFDDESLKVRTAAARALFDLQPDRAAAFTRALREGSSERRRKIGASIASSGLANEAIGNLTGESREKTYDAFSLLFLMSKAGEIQPLMRAIEEHPSIEVRLAVIKLLALSGQSEVLAAFRRMAVRGSLPPEVRSALMEAIYQINSESPSENASIQ